VRSPGLLERPIGTTARVPPGHIRERLLERLYLASSRRLEGQGPRIFLFRRQRPPKTTDIPLPWMRPMAKARFLPARGAPGLVLQSPALPHGALGGSNAGAGDRSAITGSDEDAAGCLIECDRRQLPLILAETASLLSGSISRWKTW
jgi:hypothetical protein